MLSLKTRVAYLKALATILLALLFPVLHVHPDFGHAHADHGVHHGAVIHADFFAAFAHGHAEKPTDTRWDESESGLPDQIALAVLVSRPRGSFGAVSQSDLVLLLLFFEPVNSPQDFHQALAIKSDHPPPELFYPALNFPRSPPQPI